MRKKRPLDRSANVLRDASLVVIASEDTCAVRQYFDFFQSTRIHFRVLETQQGRSAPQHVLARLDEYRSEYEIGAGDEFWLLCDCDHWITNGHIKNLTRVKKECRQKDIRVALSNPCLKLWLLLHFAEFPSETKLTRAQLEKRIRDAVGFYDKTRVDKLPIDGDAVKAAIERSKSNQPSASEIPEVLQTGVHAIIEDLITRDVISIG